MTVWRPRAAILRASWADTQMIATAAILSIIAAFGYPASGAWSISRRLVATWTGAIIRVRKSSGGEMDVGTIWNGRDWVLDIAAIAAWAGSDSVFITTVYDQTGGGAHLTMTTAGSQPRLINAGTPETIGTRGRAAALLIVAGNPCLLNNGWTFAAACTVNAVAAASAGTYLVNSATGTNGRNRINSNFTGLMGAGTPTVGNTVTVGTAAVVTVAVSGTGTATQKQRLNGAETGSNSITRGTSGAGLNVGVLHNEEWAELVCWQSVPPDAALLTLERDQGRFYGLAVA